MILYIYNYFWFRGSWFCVVAAVQTKERARSREKKRTSITYLKLHTILVVIICPPEQSAPKRCSLQTCRQGTVSVSLQQMLPFAAGGAARVCPNCAGKDGARKYCNMFFWRANMYSIPPQLLYCSQYHNYSPGHEQL